MAKAKFEFTLKSGAQCVLDGEYTATMGRNIVDSDGYKVDLGPEVKTQSRLTAYVDGKKVDETIFAEFWRLIDSPRFKGAKKIWGLIINIADPEVAKKYENWVAELIDAGTSDEVKAFNAAEAQKELAKKIKNAQALIAKAEKQDKIRTAKETRAYLRNLNNVMNEGGEGYLPHLVTLEEYEDAKQFLQENGTR